ncbi:MAG: cell division protein FtsL [Pacificibacter sp.]|mgnify:FL=1|uniref:cell division protein FtsL n=1 Tax=Pacificibacter sp. TaxID=1917866 RepID=UPI003218ED18
MRSVYIVFSALFVMGLAVWAYKENYATQEVLREISQVQRQIGLQRQELAVQRAEWAYQNRPDRLRDLVELNFDRLGLLPLLPEQFGTVANVAFPVEEDVLIELEDSVAVSGSLEAVNQ